MFNNTIVSYSILITLVALLLISLITKHRNEETDDTKEYLVDDSIIKYKKIKYKDAYDDDITQDDNRGTIDDGSSSEVPSISDAENMQINEKNTNTIKQIRLDNAQCQNPKSMLSALSDHGLKYPMRIRPAHDILRPINSDSGDVVATNRDEFIALCTELLGNYEFPYGVAVQQNVPRTLNEYILSCSNGVIDKLYLVNGTKQPVQEISLENLSVQNKKTLRKIIHMQHKKHKTVNIIVELGFVCTDPSRPLQEDENFKIVGVCVKFGDGMNHNKKQVSYPFVGEIDFVK